MLAPEVIVVPAVFGSVAAVILTRMRLGHRERMAALVPRPTTAPDQDERLTRLETAVDAIAVEVERIGEGQRFVTRLLSERPAAVATAVDGSPPTASLRSPD